MMPASSFLYLSGFFFQVFYIDVAIVQRFHDHHFHTGHYSAGRIGAVCRNRDQHNITVLLTPAFMPASNGQQSCIFSLCAAVWLETARIERRDPAQIFTQLIDYELISLRLVGRSERMDLTPMCPAQRASFLKLRSISWYMIRARSSMYSTKGLCFPVVSYNASSGFRYDAN